MKKTIIACLCVICFVFAALAADVVITITIPEAKVAKARAGILARFPVETDDKGVPLYTDLQWIKRLLVTNLIEWTKSGEEMLAVQAARSSIVVDNDLAQ